MAPRLFRRFFPDQTPTQVGTSTHEEKSTGQPKPAHDVTVTDQQQESPSPAPHVVGSAVVHPVGSITGKEICTSNRLAVLWNFALFHLPSIAVTLTLFVFHVRGFCWAKEPTDDQLSALLFPAKAHEILIVMSLSDILLHRIMYGLIKKTGIALGFITAPFHIVDPFYLVSPSFWSTVRRPERGRRFHHHTVLILVLLVIMGVAVGPLSATLMTPRKDWVETPTGDGWSKKHIIRNPDLFYVDREPYPQTLTPDYAQQTYGLCNMAADDYEEALEECIKYDIKPFIHEVEAFSQVAAGETRAQYNISVTRDGTSTLYRPLSTSMSSKSGLATGPMDFVAWDLNFYYLSSSTSSRDVMFLSSPKALGPVSASLGLKKWKQPLVIVTCAPGAYDGAEQGSLSFSWDDELLEKYQATLTMPEIREALHPLDNLEVDDAKSFSLHLRESRAPPLPVSATILLSDHTASEWEEGDGPASARFELCYIVARWHESDVWTDTRLPTGAQSELGLATDDIFDFMEVKDDPAVASVTMTDDWLELIGPIPDDPQAPEANTDYPALLGASARIVDKTPSTPSVVLSRLLALYMADAMTMSSAFSSVPREDLDDVEAGPDGIAMEVSATAYSHLYTYNFEDTRSRPVAFALLFLHMVLAVAHHLIILLSPSPWHSTGWGSAEELISLALRSDPPEGDFTNMDNIVTSSASRTLPILIQRRDGDKKLEMVVAPPEGVVDDVEASADGGAPVRRRINRVESGFDYN